MFDNLIGHLFFVAEQSLLVVVSCQIAVNHLSMITNTHLRTKENKIKAY